MKRRKPEFKVGQVVNLPVKVLKIDRRWNPPRYAVQALEGWYFEDLIELPSGKIKT